ncbi:hypothetical protein F66182_1979 [Fusarium sp. NRRL 66182]|nr:hypothetical protein F66182_1979 [Fusarium sp. NRRL 66182]
MSDSRRRSKSPLRSLDPQPVRSPSPSRDRGRDRGPERTKSYPGLESHRYGPQSYGTQDYNPPEYGNQSFNAQNYDAQGFSSQNYNQSYNPQNYPPTSGPQTGPGNIPMRPASESYLPNIGSMATKHNQMNQLAPTMLPPTDLRELQDLKTNCLFGLREYRNLQRQRQSGDSAMSAYELETRLRTQTTIVLNDLRMLQGEVRGIAKEAEGHRWRRWIIGGAIATFIPLIRRFWRRGDDEESDSSANDTEYAFKKSKGLLAHIKNGVLGHGRFAKLAFLVFAVLFVFSNEVSLRVARTVQKRIRKLCVRLEQGDPDIDDKDMKLLEGWRWRAHDPALSSQRLISHLTLPLQTMGQKRKASQDFQGQLSADGETAQQTAWREPLDGPPKDDTARDRHYAELYAKSPDFDQLALQDADFARLWNQHKPDFFNDPECVMQLTKTLLKLDFGLKLELPDDRLCPPVTNRHNYLLWLKGLVDSTSYGKQGRRLVGLDIGTGASCIYPLIGCTERNWEFIATDIDSKSLEYARRNVALNNLDHRIKIVERKPADVLIPLDELNITSIAFTMTNPPFYKSEQELLESAQKKSETPFTACTGAKVEMVTDGGEVAFLDRILKESLILRERVQWYTAMFGFLSNLIEFVDKLREHGIDNYAVTEFVQGSKTRRWAVAWSFGSMRPTQEVARGIGATVSKSVLPEITEETVVDVPLRETIGEFVDPLRAEVEKLDMITWEWDSERLEGTGRVAGRVWARAWRRRKQRQGIDAPKNEEAKCVFAFKIFIRVGRDGVSVGCRWLEGHDAVAFESFRGYLKSTARAIFNPQKVKR